MANKTNRVQVMLDDATFDALREAAANDRRSISEYLRILIEEHVK